MPPSKHPKTPDEILEKPEARDEFMITNGTVVKIDKIVEDTIRVSFNGGKKLEDIKELSIENFRHAFKNIINRTKEQIMSEPKNGDVINTPTLGIVRVVNFDGEMVYIKHDDGDDCVELGEFRKIADSSLRTTEEIMECPRRGDQPNTVTFGRVYVCGMDDNTVEIMKPDGEPTDIPLEEFRKMIDPSLRSVEEIMKDPWCENEILTKTYGRIKIVEKIGGHNGVVTVRIFDTHEEIQMTVNVFNERYKDDLIE